MRDPWADAVTEVRAPFLLSPPCFFFAVAAPVATRLGGRAPRAPPPTSHPRPAPAARCAPVLPLTPLTPPHPHAQIKSNNGDVEAMVATEFSKIYGEDFSEAS